MPICSFNVDGEAVDLNLDRVPRAEEYAGIFPEARVVRMTGWRYSETVGVAVGIASAEYNNHLVARLTAGVSAYSATGGALSVASGRLRYRPC